MIVHQWPRRGGKTTAAMDWLLEDLEKRMLVVSAERRMREILLPLRGREDYGEIEKRVRTWNDFVDGRLRGLTYDGVWFDQLDHMLGDYGGGRGQIIATIDA